MAANTKIEWCDHTFNPWVGCTRVGPGCDHCYAEAWARRTGQSDLWDGERRLTKTWRDPVKWDRDARQKGIRYRVFCASLADVFDNAVADAWRADLWNLIRATPNLDWIIVTKRIGNAAKMVPPDWGRGWPHVWILATVCNQAEADRDIPKLLATAAAVRGISYEPALGLVDVGYLRIDDDNFLDALTGEFISRARMSGGGTAMIRVNKPVYPPLDWIICGGESGPGARPIHPDWARSMRDQCEAAGVAFFFKQWGAWTPGENVPGDRRYPVKSWDEDAGAWFDDSDHWVSEKDNGPLVYRVGKNAAGHVLDGREWLEFPGAAGAGR